MSLTEAVTLTVRVNKARGLKVFFLYTFSRDAEGNSCWEVIAMPEESCKWNPNQDLPPIFDQSFEITDLTSGISQIALPTVPESPFFRLVSAHSCSVCPCSRWLCRVGTYGKLKKNVQAHLELLLEFPFKLPTKTLTCFSATYSDGTSSENLFLLRNTHKI